MLCWILIDELLRLRFDGWRPDLLGLEFELFFIPLSQCVFFVGYGSFWPMMKERKVPFVRGAKCISELGGVKGEKLHWRNILLHHNISVWILNQFYGDIDIIIFVIHPNNSHSSSEEFIVLHAHIQTQVKKLKNKTVPELSFDQREVI